MAFDSDLRRFHITTGSVPTTNVRGIVDADGRCIYQEYLSASDIYSGWIVGVLTDLTDKYSDMASYALSYIDPDEPAFVSISPDTGAAAGGTSFTITTTGTNSASCSVTFDGVAATAVTWNGTQIKGTSPAGSAGTADIVITTAEGTDTELAAWTYT